MLHRINLSAYRDLMNSLLDFQREVLVFACAPSTSLPFEEAEVRAHFGDAGQWLWDRLWHQGDATKFYEKLARIAAHVKGNVEVGKRILDAFEHDTSFASHLDDGSFQFKYRTELDPDDQNAVKELMELFYDSLFELGFPPSVHGGSIARFNRVHFLNTFREVNETIEVCPGCDGQPPDRLAGKQQGSLDHFLPKAKYPFLSIHPSNLVPLCSDCNQYYKGQLDPIDDHRDAPLVNSFHPYGRPAIDHVAVKLSRNDRTGKLEVRINDEKMEPSRRVESFNRILQLEQRWEDTRLSQVIYDLRSNLLGSVRVRERTGDAPSRKDLEDELTQMISFSVKDSSNEIGKRLYSVLRVNYLKYVLKDDTEFLGYRELLERAYL